MLIMSSLSLILPTIDKLQTKHIQFQFFLCLFFVSAPHSICVWCAENDKSSVRIFDESDFYSSFVLVHVFIISAMHTLYIACLFKEMVIRNAQYT